MNADFAFDGVPEEPLVRSVPGGQLMRPRQLPQGVLSRWMDLSDRVEQIEAEAASAEIEVS